MRRRSSVTAQGEPLSSSQVEAACRIHDRLKQWQLSEQALLQLRERMPGFDATACLLKSVAVNAIYGTRVFAIVRMAQWVEKIMAKPDEAVPNLVETMANLPKKHGEKKERSFTSFAAKFCHFFVDEERFPIYDEAARNTLKRHLGKDYVDKKEQLYVAFCGNFSELFNRSGLTCRSRELDHYLWLTGMYQRWLKNRDKPSPLVNEELLKLFKAPGGSAADLDALLPSSVDRTFLR